MAARKGNNNAYDFIIQAFTSGGQGWSNPVRRGLCYPWVSTSLFPMISIFAYGDNNTTLQFLKLKGVFPFFNAYSLMSSRLRIRM